MQPVVNNIPLVGGMFVALLMQTALAASKLRLIGTAFTPSPQDTLAAMESIEIAFSGYTSGGYALADWLNPVNDPQGGVSIQSPTVQPQVASGGTAGTVYGWFLVDATGSLIANGTIGNPIGMVNVGDGFPISVKLWYATTTQLTSCSIYGGENLVANNTAAPTGI
jgi:hypothetical protein